MSLIGNKPNQVPCNASLGALAYKDVVGLEDVGSSINTIASSSTIAPNKRITFISGTTTINTIEPPAEFKDGGQIVLIPTGLWSTGTSGNIALATTAVVNRPLTLTYDAATIKWYPSY